jgi:hypothetical protein
MFMEKATKTGPPMDVLHSNQSSTFWQEEFRCTTTGDGVCARFYCAFWPIIAIYFLSWDPLFFQRGGKKSNEVIPCLQIGFPSRNPSFAPSGVARDPPPYILAPLRGFCESAFPLFTRVKDCGTDSYGAEIIFTSLPSVETPAPSGLPKGTPFRHAAADAVTNPIPCTTPRLWDWAGTVQSP